ncbi:MAG: hypothetical protein HUK20_07485, partial [Fibrobacter sp.]|nr:hypothetical protein [Fibrobacter sp.]
AMALSSVAGKYLAEGMPKAGALVRACKKMILPMTCSSFVALGALAFDMPAVNDLKEIALAVETAGAAAKSGTSQVWGAVLYYFIFNVWFFAFLFPVISFGPWNRLRSGSRRVEMKPRKKAKK